MKKIILFVTAVYMILSGCKKADFNDNTVTGEGLVSFTIVAPASGTVLRLNAAIPNETVSFKWNASKPGLTETPSYKVVAALRTGGNLNAPLLSFDADNNGKATTLTLTYKQLDDALAAKGIAAGVNTDLQWSVTASNGSVQLLAQSIFYLTVTRFKDGASPFFLLGPSSSTGVQEITPTSTTDNLNFNWTRSKPATGGGAITYKVLFAERKLDGDGKEIPVEWSTGTLFSIASNNLGVDSLLTISHKQINDSLVKYGFSDFGNIVNLKWTVKATSGTWDQISEYQNILFLSRLIKYDYPQALNVAGNHQGWSPETAPQLVALSPVGGPYSEYSGFINFANSDPQFKLVRGNNWGAGDYGMLDATTIGGGNNFTLASTGVYLLKANTATMTWSATKINSFGLIGSATPNGWDAEQTMTHDVANKKYTITLNLTTGEIKFRANNSWDLNLGDDGANGTVEINGANIAVASPGNYTVTLSVENGGNWRYSLKRN